MIEPGIYQMPEKEYRSLKAINQSSLRHALRSPAHYIENTITPSEQTSAMVFGSAFHCYLLERDQFESGFAIQPETISSKASKAFKEFEKECGQKLIVTQDDMDRIITMASIISHHRVASDLLSGGVAESVLVWKDPKTDLLCKGKLDYIKPVASPQKDSSNYVIVDVKTTKDARPWSFAKSCHDYGYHFQSAFYLDAFCRLKGVNRSQVDYLIIAIEPTRPHGLIVYRLGSESIDLGRRDYQKALGAIKECEELGGFYCYPEEIMSLQLPSYAFKEGTM